MEGMLIPSQVVTKLRGSFDPSTHPRWPGGTPGIGGQFRPSNLEPAAMKTLSDAVQVIARGRVAPETKAGLLKDLNATAKSIPRGPNQREELVRKVHEVKKRWLGRTNIGRGQAGGLSPHAEIKALDKQVAEFEEASGIELKGETTLEKLANLVRDLLERVKEIESLGASKVLSRVNPTQLENYLELEVSDQQELSHNAHSLMEWAMEHHNEVAAVLKASISSGANVLGVTKRVSGAGRPARRQPGQPRRSPRPSSGSGRAGSSGSSSDGPPKDYVEVPENTRTGQDAYRRRKEGKRFSRGPNAGKRVSAVQRGKTVKRVLRVLGYDASNPAEALAKFQKEHNLEPTGKVDRATIQAMRSKLGKLRRRRSVSADSSGGKLKRVKKSLSRNYGNPIAKASASDGDGDGFIYDGTPAQRPATPGRRGSHQPRAGHRPRRGRGGKHPVGDMESAVRGKVVHERLNARATELRGRIKKIEFRMRHASPEERNANGDLHALRMKLAATLALMKKVEVQEEKPSEGGSGSADDVNLRYAMGGGRAIRH